MSRLQFQLQAQAPGSRARAARFESLHGPVETPIFMPVGTQATVKSQTRESLLKVGSNVLLANTYHLMLRPGREVFEKLGGIHRFMKWDRPVLTDSGGFQIFSLPHARKITEDGAAFQSYVDGTLHHLTPESSIGMQKAIGSDIMMVLDQCIPSTANRDLTLEALGRTHRWAQRSLAARGDSPQSMFGIVQGACYEDLRKQSADQICALPFDGFAIGGLAVGETKQERDDFTEWTASLLPTHLPRYLMGVGTPIDLLEAVHRGVDMFDCILPSSLAQRGTAFTSIGKMQLRRTVYKFADEALDPNCSCDTCTQYSRAYLHHLYKCDEILGWHLIAQHNLTFYHQLMSKMRSSILDGTFSNLYQSLRIPLAQSDEANPVHFPGKSRKRTHKVPTTLRDHCVHEMAPGHFTIRHLPSGEVMHPMPNPMDEARRLYVEQSRLTEKLSDAERKDPLVLWDVGLGAAMNAMTAIRAAEELHENQTRPLVIVSFESDLDPLRLVVGHARDFPHARHSAPGALLKDGQWTSTNGKIKWILREGHFPDHLQNAWVPEIIFYDPYSSQTNAPLWTSETFLPIRELIGSGQASLFTFTASTSVRSALLASGFAVCKGLGSGTRPDTTVAHTRIEGLREDELSTLLDDTWLARWRRSTVRGADPRVHSQIELHPQFHREKSTT